MVNQSIKQFLFYIFTGLMICVTSHAQITPDSEEDIVLSSSFDEADRTSQCSWSNSSWQTVDQPSFTLNLGNRAITSSQQYTGYLSYPEALARSFESSNPEDAITPFLTYPLAVNVSKGPESSNGQGGTVFTSGGVIFNNPNGGNIVTGALRHSNSNSNNLGSFNTTTFVCPAPFNVAPLNCYDGLYLTETGSLGIRALDVRNNYNLMIMEDNVFRETSNSGNTMEKIADLNTQLANAFGSPINRILVTDTYYNRDIANTAIVATAVVQLTNGVYISAVLTSVGNNSNNGKTWSVASSNILSTATVPGLAANSNIWITSIALTNKFDSQSSNQNPMVVVSGYTNVGSGPSSWFIARKNLSSGSWNVIEANQITAGRFTTVNRSIITPKGELFVAGQVIPGANGVTVRKGILRKYQIEPSGASVLDSTEFVGSAYDVGLADYDGTIVASTTQGTQPTAKIRNYHNTNDEWVNLPMSQIANGFGYEIQADDNRRLFWAVQDGSIWKLLRLSCNH